MLISPPFLVARNADESDSDWIDRCMNGDAPGAGAFPVSLGLRWHGGLHLRAPVVARHETEPVRAVADGSVVYLRQPGAQDLGTDTGVVVLRHATEIGEGADAAVTFFSIYVHLSRIEPAVQPGRTLARKTALGVGGQIYGEAVRRIHFEIVCDDANLRRLMGAPWGDGAPQADGRSDALYGEAYFHLPPATPVYAQQPLPHSAQAQVRDAGGHARALAAAGDTGADALVVGLRYLNGDAAAERGAAVLTTYRLDGTALDNPVRELRAEYELFARANIISEAYPAAARPIPSAVYELLRWGRVLGADALAPADVPHWRRIGHPGGQGWVNLNATGVRKFSDADLPPWKRWLRVDDSADEDCRCDSPTLRGWLDADDDGEVTLAEATARLSEPAVARKMARAVCKFATEWDPAGYDRRWGWLKERTPDNPEPMSEADFERGRAHFTALAFWPADNALPPAHHWHWNPREFIKHFRQCTWLSDSEFRQLQPSHAIRTTTRDHRTVNLWEGVDPMIAGRNEIPARYRAPLNKMMRKYGINCGKRLAAFFGNALQESIWMRSLSEIGGSTTWYAPWYGRGFLQLTNPANYCDYWAWRGRTVPEALREALIAAYHRIEGTRPGSARSNAGLADTNFEQMTAQIREWRQDVLGSTAPDPTDEQVLTPVDSAGFYWAKLRMAAYADETHTLERHVVGTDDGRKVYYRSLPFWRASAAVNLPGAVGRIDYRGLNGFDSRCCAYGVVLAVVAEVKFPDAQDELTLSYPEGYTPRRP